MRSFFSHGVKEHLGKSNQLMKLSAMLDWMAFAPLLGDVLRRWGPADPDATWLKKGSKSHFGYQSFVQCDAEGFVEHTHTTPANLAETKELERAVSEVQRGVRVRVLADKVCLGGE